MLSEIPAWGDILTRASVWLALLGYLAGPCAALVGRQHLGWQRSARAIYTLGLVAFLIHVAAAFHAFYGWSHATALVETAKETAEVTGVASGSGLYLNYLFTVLWILDAIWWWRVGVVAFRRRSAWVSGALHGFFLFMAFNATVVFEQGPVRWAGVLAAVALVILVARRQVSAGRSRLPRG